MSSPGRAEGASPGDPDPDALSSPPAQQPTNHCLDHSRLRYLLACRIIPSRGDWGFLVMRYIFVALAGALIISGCARSEAVRTSANTMIIQTGAAPVCGGTGALRVAQQLAAVETIRAGYDRYIITGGQAQNNVVVNQMPGSFRTTGTYGAGFYQARTTYQPGATIVSGSHDQGLAVVMFREGDAGAQQAVSAREMLGPDWSEKVKNGIRTCL